MRTLLRSLAAGLAGVLLGALPAIADDVGEVGTLVGLQVNTTLADTYLQYHGRAFVKVADGTLDEYRWGGTSCNTKVLTENQVAALQRVLDNAKVRIQPLSLPGQGQIICLVGFTVVQKSALKLVIP